MLRSDLRSDYLGGRDDPFFNDLPGFFRSINYGPQFYEIPLSMSSTAESPIPKTLLDRAIVAEVNHLRALCLQQTTHHIDGDVVPVEQRSSRHNADAGRPCGVGLQDFRRAHGDPPPSCSKISIREAT